MNDDVFIRVANETWHISVDHHGICFLFFVSIETRKSCGSRFRSSGTACVTPTPPDQWSGWAAVGSPCRRRRSPLDRCYTRTDSWSAKSTLTRTAREVRLRPFHLHICIKIRSSPLKQQKQSHLKVHLVAAWEPLITSHDPHQQMKFVQLTLSIFFYLKCCSLRWPWEISTLQLQKTHANRQNTRKLREHLHQFDNIFENTLQSETTQPNTESLQVAHTQRELGTLKSNAHGWEKLVVGLWLMKLLKSAKVVMENELSQTFFWWDNLQRFCIWLSFLTLHRFVNLQSCSTLPQ